MQNFLRIAVVVAVGLGVFAGAVYASEPWQGVDDTVVGKFAREAGRPPSKAFIDTDQGDLLLFCFLVSGTAGGFIAGHTFRGLFPPKVTVGTSDASQCRASSS
jgi:hypothetical protein